MLPPNKSQWHFIHWRFVHSDRIPSQITWFDIHQIFHDLQRQSGVILAFEAFPSPHHCRPVNAVRTASVGTDIAPQILALVPGSLCLQRICATAIRPLCAMLVLC